MNENTNVNIEENENSFSNKADFSDTIVNGVVAKLFQRIGTVNISDKRISDAFARYVKDVKCDKTISPSEIIASSEGVIKRYLPVGNAEDAIYCFDNAPALSKLMKYSVQGLYSLLSLRNGMTLDIDGMGGSLDAASLKRFLVLPEKKCKRLFAKLSKTGITPVRVGNMLSTNKVIFTRAGVICDSFDKSLIGSNAEPVALNITSEHFDAFISGYKSVCTVALCDRINDNNVIRFGLNDSIEYVFAKALGYYLASVMLKKLPIRSIYTSDESASVAVSRPKVVDGDYFYYLKLRCDESGMPDRSHLSQLLFYITEKKRMGIIKDVLPKKENIEGVLKSLCGNNLEYVSLGAQNQHGFGIVVSVNRGESVNGVKLGYFKNIE